MTFAQALALAALVLTDPTGDAIGDGTLTAPTAPIYASSAIFDLHEVEVAGDDSGTTVKVTLGAIENAAGLPEGFSGVVVDVYLDTAPEGAETTLDGPNMRMPEGRGWQYAIRISGDGAYAVADSERAEAAATALPGAAAPVEPADATEAAEADAEAAEADVEPGPDTLGRVPLTISRDGSTLSVRLPWVVEDRFEVYAMTGVYDPFTPTGWRPLSTTPSPWAFSGNEQVVPVVDLLAPDAATQERALRSGVLPRPETRAGSTSWWLLLMALGVALAGAGLWFRRRVQPQRVEAAVPAPETDEEATSDSVAETDEGTPSDPVADTASVPTVDTASDMPSDAAPSAPADSAPSDSAPSDSARSDSASEAASEAVSDTPPGSAPTPRSGTAPDSTSVTSVTTMTSVTSGTAPEGLANGKDGPPHTEHRDTTPEVDGPGPEPVIGRAGRVKRLPVVLTEEAGPDARTPLPENVVADDVPDAAPRPPGDPSGDPPGDPFDDPFAGFFDDDEPDENDDIDEFGSGDRGGADERDRRDGHG